MNMNILLRKYSKCQRIVWKKIINIKIAKHISTLFVIIVIKYIMYLGITFQHMVPDVFVKLFLKKELSLLSNYSRIFWKFCKEKIIPLIMMEKIIQKEKNNVRLTKEDLKRKITEIFGENKLEIIEIPENIRKHDHVKYRCCVCNLEF